MSPKMSNAVMYLHTAGYKQSPLRIHLSHIRAFIYGCRTHQKTTPISPNQLSLPTNNPSQKKEPSSLRLPPKTPPVTPSIGNPKAADKTSRGGPTQAANHRAAHSLTPIPARIPQKQPRLRRVAPVPQTSECTTRESPHRYLYPRLSAPYLYSTIPYRTVKSNAPHTLHPTPTQPAKLLASHRPAPNQSS